LAVFVEIAAKFLIEEGLYVTQIKGETEVEINMKAILVYFIRDVGRTTNMAGEHNMNQTNQNSFTNCFSFFMSRVLLILASLVMQYAKKHRSVILLLLPVCERTTGAFGNTSGQYVKKCIKQWIFHTTL
jgi:hypothetical protein